MLLIDEDGTDESPYSAISSIALDPIFLTFDPREIPFLGEPEIDAVRASLGLYSRSHLINYPAVRAAKQHLLEISFARFTAKPNPEFATFCKQNSEWLSDYCIFKLLFGINGATRTWDH